MARRRFRDTIRFKLGFILSRPKIDANTDSATSGSQNVVFLGQGKARPFKGLQLVSGVGGIFGQPISGGIAGLAPMVVTVSSVPSGVTVTVSPADLSGNGDGTT